VVSSTPRRPKTELTHNRWEIRPHPPYSPNLAPSDYCVFGPLKEHLTGQYVTSDEEIDREVCSLLTGLDTDVFCSGMGKLVKRWEKCLNKHGDCVQK
jgi:hypothetical protein